MCYMFFHVLHVVAALSRHAFRLFLFLFLFLFLLLFLFFTLAAHSRDAFRSSCDSSTQGLPPFRPGEKVALALVDDL
jgi:hypothetical protein